LKQVCKRFTSGAFQVDALKDAALTIAEAEFVALTGTSGSGKSTLLNVLGLIETPTSGRIFFDGVDVTDIGDRQTTKIRRDGVGFIFQNFNLIPTLTALENVEYALFLTQKYDAATVRHRALEALKSVG